MHEFELRPSHLSSSENHGANLLGRWHLNSSFQKVSQFFSTCGSLGLQPVSVSVDMFQLSDTI